MPAKTGNTTTTSNNPMPTQMGNTTTTSNNPMPTQTGNTTTTSNPMPTQTGNTVNTSSSMPTQVGDTLSSGQAIENGGVLGAFDISMSASNTPTSDNQTNSNNQPLYKLQQKMLVHRRAHSCPPQ